MTPTIDIDVDDLPGILQDLVELVGLQVTLTLVEHYGGVRLYVPVKYDPEHVLAKQIGHQAALKLIEMYRGDRFDIPRAEKAMRAVRDWKIREQYWGGKSQRQLAREYGLTDRQIRNILAGIEEEDLQESLF